MKKLTIIIFILSIFLLTGCETNNKPANLKEITFNELYELLDAKETFILEIFQDGCSHCTVFTPRFKTVLKDYNVEAKSLNFSSITEKQYNKFTSDFGSVATPTVIFIKDGEEKTRINRIIGEASKNEIIRKLKQNGYINE